METLQIHLGAPAWLVTVTRDDAYNSLLKIYAYADLDMDLSNMGTVLDLSNEELAKRTKKREALRVNVPGVCAWNFKNQLHAVIHGVIGWDTEFNRATKRNGYFGQCKGFALSVEEEQGRKALHTHFIVWVHRIEQAWKAMHSTSCN